MNAMPALEAYSPQQRERFLYFRNYASLLRRRNNDSHVFTFICAGGMVRAHSIMLVHSSPYLAKVMANWRKQPRRRGGFLKLKQTPVKLMRKLLNALYCQPTRVPQNQLDNIRRLISDLQLPQDLMHWITVTPAATTSKHHPAEIERRLDPSPAKDHSVDHGVLNVPVTLRHPTPLTPQPSAAASQDIPRIGESWSVPLEVWHLDPGSWNPHRVKLEPEEDMPDPQPTETSTGPPIFFQIPKLEGSDFTWQPESPPRKVVLRRLQKREVVQAHSRGFSRAAGGLKDVNEQKNHPFVCEHCHHYSRKKSRLQKHILASHIPVQREHQCALCSFSATRFIGLLRHQAVEHKPHKQCTQWCHYNRRCEGLKLSLKRMHVD